MIGNACAIYWGKKRNFYIQVNYLNTLLIGTKVKYSIDVVSQKIMHHELSYLNKFLSPHFSNFVNS